MRASSAGDRSPRATSAITARPSARRAGSSLPWARKRRAARRATTRARAGLTAEQGLGQRELALGLEAPQPTGAVRRGGGLEGPCGLARHPRRHQHLGAVLLDRGAVRRRQRSEHLTGVVHPAQRGDQVAAQELDVAEVEARLRLLDRDPGLAEPVRCVREVRRRPGRVALLEEDVAPVDEHPGLRLGVLLQPGHRLGERVQRVLVATGAHVQQPELRPGPAVRLRPEVGAVEHAERQLEAVRGRVGLALDVRRRQVDARA